MSPVGRALVLSYEDSRLIIKLSFIHSFIHSFFYSFLHSFILYINQNFIMARFPAFERNNVHQILKIACISPERLIYTLLSFSLSLCHIFFTDIKFRWLFRYLKRNVPAVSTVPCFCVPTDYKRISFFTR